MHKSIREEFVLCVVFLGSPFMSETQFLGYVANEEELVKDLMEVYTAAADNYMNLDLDKPVTYLIILDTDRKIILWRWKVDQVKKKN